MTPLSSPVVTIEMNAKHQYRVYGDPRVEGQVLSSVTTVLGIIAKPALIPWSNKEGRRAFADYLTPFLGQPLTQDMLDEGVEKARKMPDDILTAAGDVGTRVHKAIEMVLNGMDYVDATRMMGEDTGQAIDNFLSWQRYSGLDVTLTEKMVYSVKHQYAGSMDAGAYRGNKFVALDWKTSNGLYAEAAYQVSAYAKAWEEMTGEAADEAWVVRVGKTKAEFEAKQILDIDACFATFLAAKDLYNGTKAKAWV